MNHHKLSIPVVPAVLVVALVLILGIAAMATPDESDDREIARSINRQTPNADFPALGSLDGLEVAFAVVEATVVALEGPEVRLVEGGFIDYNSDEGVPLVRVAGLSEPTRLPRAESYGSEFESLKSRDGEPLPLRYTNGFFEEGRRYAFFVAGWSPGEMSVVYAHDLDSDKPVPGFSSDSSAVLAGLRTSASDSSPTPVLDNLIALAGDVQHADETESEGDIIALDVQPDMYLVQAEDGISLDGLQYVEVLILGDPSDPKEYALRNPTNSKLLGWFATNDLGYSILTGYLPVRDSSFELLSRAAGDIENTQVLSLARPETADEMLIVPDTADPDLPEVGIIVDLRHQVEGPKVATYASIDEYYEQIELLQPILDGSIEGSEPLDRMPGITLP